MVRLLGLEISRAALVFRLLLGALLATLAFFIFYYVPANFLKIAFDVIGMEIPAEASGVLSSLIEPALPFVGLALAPTIFFCTIFRGTKAYGPFTIALSLLFFAYVFLSFHGGSIYLAVPVDPFIGGLPIEPSISIRVDMALLMILFLIPPILGVLKGLLLILKS